MTIRNGERYAHNYARAAAYYLGTLAPEPTNPTRFEAYRLIRAIYEVVYDDPARLGWKPSEDVFFAPGETQKGREADVKAIRDPVAKIDALTRGLYELASAGAAAPKRPLAKALAAVGCGALPAGLMELGEIARTKGDAAYLYFSRCAFEPDGDWIARAFDALLGADGELLRLCESLEKRGYARTDCRETPRITLDYAKTMGGKDEPLKAAWGERAHLGIEISFDELRLEPCAVSLRMPMYKTVLARFDRLPEGARTFLAAHTKTCDGCRYCVQTDKTHTRPLAAIRAEGAMKCPLYPGFGMRWRALTPALAGDLLAALDAVDALLTVPG